MWTTGCDAAVGSGDPPEILDDESDSREPEEALDLPEVNTQPRAVTPHDPTRNESPMGGLHPVRLTPA